MKPNNLKVRRYITPDVPCGLSFRVVDIKIWEDGGTPLTTSTLRCINRTSDFLRVDHHQGEPPPSWEVGDTVHFVQFHTPGAAALVAVLDLSNRVFGLLCHYLRKHGVERSNLAETTLLEMTAFPADEFRLIRGVGHKTIAELRTAMTNTQIPIAVAWAREL